ncbi:MAG: hypothetical protein A2827_02995 [Candidatus Spechtbacteria bacterium RIFCSPHIGHO2_01_FULL_43_30]|uniref:Uncharacterized protein n=1 Tax=Candidatus Spechtbacteria bacterium RIFCSPHIGHO2_01_FULL_43_30 TaxID=1802158 RepID=A0A1G2H5C0_9BACT|nr:MAG: hypothetical protein A2827_02995 [Candidatus Spechtbacteria bacterium RIFCSPHIGHO2_01_FULL_43_30]
MAHRRIFTILAYIPIVFGFLATSSYAQDSYAFSELYDATCSNACVAAGGTPISQTAEGGTHASAQALGLVGFNDFVWLDFGSRAIKNGSCSNSYVTQLNPPSAICVCGK